MANSDINAKRKRDDSSLGRVPAMISGLTISDFGDLGRDYKDTLDRVASVYDNAASESQPEGKSLAERKYDGIATSSENISKYVSSHRRKSLNQEREGYHNRCALRHCEVPRLINNPFVEACKCSHPSRSAGDLLKRVAVLHPGPVLTLWTVGRDAGGGMGGGGPRAEVARVLALRQEPRRSRQRQVMCWGRGGGKGQSRRCISALY